MTNLSTAGQLMDIYGQAFMYNQPEQIDKVNSWEDVVSLTFGDSVINDYNLAIDYLSKVTPATTFKLKIRGDYWVNQLKELAYYAITHHQVSMLFWETIADDLKRYIEANWDFTAPPSVLYRHDTKKDKKQLFSSSNINHLANEVYLADDGSRLFPRLDEETATKIINDFEFRYDGEPISLVHWGREAGARTHWWLPTMDDLETNPVAIVHSAYLGRAFALLDILDNNDQLVDMLAYWEDGYAPDGLLLAIEESIDDAKNQLYSTFGELDF